MSEDNYAVEPCPLCKHMECEKHLLACFDKAGNGDAFGLVNGALCYVNEIEVVLDHASLAWVRSMRSAGRPKPPVDCERFWSQAILRRSRA